MLYERWLQVARDRKGEVALRDLAAGKQWTFGQLLRAAEAGPSSAEPACPTGQGGDFILAVLQAWRSGTVVCPLESGQGAPPLGDLPTGIAHVKTTSASTGAPRCVLFTADQLAADAENIVGTMGLRFDWPNLGVVSLAHSYGFSNLVLPLLLYGIPLILAGSALPEAVRRASHEAGDVTLAAVPALWAAWYEAGCVPTRTRLAISAAAPLPLLLEQQIFECSALKIHNFYGSTECGGIAYDRTDRPRVEETCAGSPMQNVQLSLDEAGCLVVRSRAVGQAYWPEQAPSLRAGVFRTSDLATLSNGSVLLRGRFGDQINVAGRKVSPEAIERVLSDHPMVRRCIVFGIASEEPERGEVIVACLEMASPVNPDVLRSFVAEHLPAWQVPRDWWYVNSLETNRRGKVSRAQWRERYLEEKRRVKTPAGR